MTQYQTLVLRFLLLIASVCLNMQYIVMKSGKYDDVAEVMQESLTEFKDLEIQTNAFIRGIN